MRNDAKNTKIDMRTESNHDSSPWELVEYLKEQIPWEREQANQRVQEAVERERRERERANNYEIELAELRKDHESLIKRLLPEPPQSTPEPPKLPKPGFFSRLFGRGR